MYMKNYEYDRIALNEDFRKSFKNKFRKKSNEELKLYCRQYVQWRKNREKLDNELGDMIFSYYSIRGYMWKAVLISDLLDILEYNNLDELIKIICKVDYSRQERDIRFGYANYNYVQRLLDIGYKPLQDLRDVFHTNNFGEVCALRIDYIGRTIDTAGNYDIGEDDELKPIEDLI